MAWIAKDAPPELAGALEAYRTFAGIAVEWVDTLHDAAEFISAAARPAGAEGEDAPAADAKVLQLAVDLQTFRAQLIDAGGLHKELLSRAAVQELRDGFAFAGMGSDDDVVKRQELTEKVVGHPVARLAELTLDEAARLNSRLRELEQSF